MGVCPCAGTKPPDTEDVFFTSSDHLKEIIDKEFKELFEKSDKNHDGNLDKNEVEGLLKELEGKGLVLSTKTSKQVIEKCDANGDGKIQKQEFQTWITKECQDKRNNLLNYLNKSGDKAWIDEITAKAFKEVDKDGSGSIDIDELYNYLKAVSDQLGEEPYTREQVAKVLSIADTDKDKKVSAVEFRTTMKAVIVKLFCYKKPDAAAAAPAPAAA